MVDLLGWAHSALAGNLAVELHALESRRQVWERTQQPEQPDMCHLCSSLEVEAEHLILLAGLHLGSRTLAAACECGGDR